VRSSRGSTCTQLHMPSIFPPAHAFAFGALPLALPSASPPALLLVLLPPFRPLSLHPTPKPETLDTRP
jgi:hypothetical protein